MRVSTRRRAISWAMVIALAFASQAAGAARGSSLPSFNEVRDAWQASDVIVRARDGEAIAFVREDFSARRGDWVGLADISPAMRTAIVLSEDKRFWSHGGVDWQAAAGAAWANLWNTRTRGASTLTMQLAGLLDEDLRRAGARRSTTQKVSQAWQATALERGWSKAQILEAYLNLVPFRGELVGLSALSQAMFGKHPGGLDAREAAVAVALVRAPNARLSQVTERACGVLRAGSVASRCAGMEGFAALALQRVARSAGVAVQPTTGTVPALAQRPQLAPHLGRVVVGRARAAGPLPAAIVTTLDAGVQRAALRSLDRHLRELAGRHAEDGAVIVLDNATGDVLAYVGSSGGLSGAAAVDHAQALRQAGSTLKPFLYAQALEERRLTAASLLDDRPVNLPTGGGLYIPQNYDGHYAGWVSTRAALAASLNVPAVRTLVMVTPHRFHRRLRTLGLPLTEAGDYYGYSLALGSADVPLLALTNAYRALANGGIYGPVRMRRDDGVSAAAPGVRVIAAAPAYVVGDILSDRHARARTFGLDSPLTTRFWSAVKTGTSKDMRDNWCIGWSQRYTVGVWIGNASGASMRDVSGVSGAAPVWHDVMTYLHEGVGSAPPSVPAGVDRRHIVFDGSLEAARDEVFVAGTALTRVRLGDGVGSRGATAMESYAGKAASNIGGAALTGERGGVPMIASPADGTIFALDPDIPPSAQRVWFEAQGVSGALAPRVSWRMDGKPLGRGGKVAWMPWPGRHRVELLDAHGSVVHRIAIEVRGATLRADRR